MPNPKPREVAAGVTTDDVRRAYYDDAPWSYWITSMELEPLQLIVMDDNTGKLYRIPVTIAGADSEGPGFTFEPAIEVAVQYVDKPAAPATTAASAGVGRLVYASRAESRPGQQVSAAAIAVHHTGTTDGSWSAATNRKNLSNEDGATEYRQAYAWVDPDGDPDTKSAYRFIHHVVNADGTVGDANVKACQTGIGVLNGGMDGTTIPDADKAAVYKHLAAHLSDAGLDAPDLQAAAGHDHHHTPHAGAPADVVSAAEPTTTPTTEEDDVSTMTELRSKLGLADDADDAAVLAAVEALQAKADEPPETPPVAAANLPAGVVAIDQATLDELRTNAAAGVEARTQQQTEARERLVDDAIRAGKVPPARREHWLAAHAADPTGTAATLASLAPGLVPVTTTGYAGGDSAVDDDAEFAGMFPPDTTEKGA